MGSKERPDNPGAGGGKAAADEQAAVVWEQYSRTSLNAKIVRFFLWLTVRKALAFLAYMPRVRHPWALADMLASLVVFPERGYHGALVRLPHCDALWHTKNRKDEPRAILYLHGGGFISCGLHTHRGLATKIADAAQASVLSVGYRQLPEHYVDESVEDCVLGYRWLLDGGYTPEQIALAGDSAGGYLVFATAFRLRQEGLPLPAALVGICPFTDWTLRTKTNHRNESRDAFLSRPLLYYIERKMGEARDRATVDNAVPPQIDLFDQPARGFPPVLLHASSSEVLLPDAQRLATTLAEAAVPVTAKLWRGQPHDFHIMSALIPEAKRAIADIGEFVQSATSIAGEADCEHDEDE
ncbi:Alpha/beta hydrolase fold-3 domain protein [Segniliparus rotundus DSM 44985]|uniref:Alpha/beta hydrolase fold-3 domain protein n=1 Tax=Segniliparus rotundus (strain ATCC BAA-972 / CDC 1076 / CIP 108378 / DSM 44985 / JCM 13578) TaxID=640132 RepID=D6Z908_SEGRD|nr:alpha/beta hydrolase [Segniliparus rotundus]ADG98438.1 Alpha/beta hydrolase fold-3 domain protein [Segniliparus rotundus DSM 44985]